MTTRLPVGLFGSYPRSSLHLAQLLVDHPLTELVYLAAPAAVCQQPLLAAVPQVESGPLEVTFDHRPDCAVVFLDLPLGKAAQQVPLLQRYAVIDLSADYRFSDLAVYQRGYQIYRSDEATAATAVYGLPEWFGEALPQARLVGCPSSVATAALLATVPLLKRGLIAPDRIVLDIKRGDRRGVRAYSRTHALEIETVGSELAGSEIIVQVRSHSVPEPYGLLATLYADLRDPGLVSEDLTTIYRAAYRQSAWVRILPSHQPVSPMALVGTNACHIGVEVDTRTQRAIASVALDPYLKGKAGQAVQCLNRMQGWDEMTGLPRCSYR